MLSLLQQVHSLFNIMLKTSLLLCGLMLPVCAQQSSELPGSLTFLPDELSSSYDFRADVTRNSPDAVLEIAFHWSNEQNHYLIHLNQQRCELSRIHQGLALPIAEATVAIEENTAHRLLLKRRPDSIRFYVDDRLLIHAVDTNFSGGKLGLRGEGKVSITRSRYQPVSSIVFTDDFMRASQNEVWSTEGGEWGPHALTNASMSTNAFYYQGRATDGVSFALVGQSFWDTYEVEASIRMTDKEGGGLVACHRDADNHYLLKWSGEKIGMLRLIRKADGVEEVLAERLLPYHLGHWYRIKFTAADGELVAAVDGHEVLTARDERLYQGRSGLFSLSPAGVHFDDVSIRSTFGIRERFNHEVTGRWQRFGGTWQEGISTFGGVFPGDSCLRVDTEDPAKAILSRDVPSDFHFEADTFAPEGVFGLCFFYRDEVNYWLARVTPKGASLIEKREGQLFVHDKIDALFPPALRRVSVVTERNVIRVKIDGHQMQAVAAEPEGRVGFYAAKATQTAFDNAVLTRASLMRPVFIQHKVFSGERTMAGWAVAQADWESAPLDGMKASWHRGTFPGDVAMRVVLDERQQGHATLRLRLGGSRSDENAGSSLAMEFSNSATFTISSGGKALADSKDVPVSFPCSLTFSQFGKHAVLQLNQKNILMSELPASSTGREIAWAAEGIAVEAEDVFVEARNSYVHTFKTSPVDWVTASGTWKVTNRWTCDPRWSFFSGYSDGLAALWNKRPLRGDLTVEFAAGPKMNPTLGGSNYTKYAHDINVTICGDGKDLTTGYSLIFGGWNNSRSRLLRNNKIVAESSSVIPTSGLHRRWLYFKAEKKGNEISLTVEGDKILSFTDPNPLPGDRMALWTFKNGVMVARVRTAADEIGEPSFPAFAPPTWGTCIYNHPAQPAKVTEALNRLAAAEPETVGNAAYDLSQLREPSTIPNLVPLLKSEDDNCRWQAASALASIGLSGIEALLTALDTENEQQRWKMEAALRKSGPEAAPLIVKTLLTGTKIQRQSCAFILRDVPAEETYRGLVAAMADDDEDVRWKSADSLVNLGREAVPFVVRALRDKDTQIRQTAAWVLGKMPKHAPVSALVGALGDADKDVRWKAADALKELSPRPEADLVAAFATANDQAQKLLWWVLSSWKYEGLADLRKTEKATPETVATAETRMLRIQKCPVGSSVYVNDTFAGVGPGSFAIPTGKSLVTLTRHGYSPWVSKVTEDMTDDLVVDIRPLSKLALTVLSTPPSATVYLNDELRGATPVTLEGVTPGRHVLRLEREGCFPETKELNLSPNKNESVKLKLSFKGEKYYLDQLKSTPNMASYRTELAHIYFLMNEFDKGRDQLVEAFRLVKRGQDQSGYSSRLTQEVGKMVSAFFDYGDQKSISHGRLALEKVYLTLVRDFAGDAALWYSLATLQQSRGAYSEVIRNMNEAIRHCPNDWTVHLSLGIAQYTLAAQGKRQYKSQAEASLNKAKALAPAKQQNSVEQHLQNVRKLP